MSAAPNGSNRDPVSRSDDDNSMESESSTGFDGDSSYEHSSVESSQVGVDAEIPMSPDQAAAIIQGLSEPSMQIILKRGDGIVLCSTRSCRA